jgi:hypothetical protein
MTKVYRGEASRRRKVQCGWRNVFAVLRRYGRRMAALREAQAGACLFYKGFVRGSIIHASKLTSQDRRVIVFQVQISKRVWIRALYRDCP